jgi:hypothetical protein
MFYPLIRLCHNDPILPAQLAGQCHTSPGMQTLRCNRGIDRIIEVGGLGDIVQTEAIRHDRAL